MAINDPIWSYGKSKLIKSSGATVASADDIWSYGKDELRHEYVAAGGAEQQAVAGSMPSPSGALALKVGFNISGSMPSPAGALARSISFNLAGDMPTAQGSLLKKISAALLAGVMPYPSASLANRIVVQQALDGAMPTSTGAITRKVSFNVAGILPEITGAISKAIYFSVSGVVGAITGAISKALSIIGLAGNMPNPSGSLGAGWHTFKDDLVGDMPTTTGSVTSEVNPVVRIGKLMKIIGMSFRKLIGG